MIPPTVAAPKGLLMIVSPVLGSERHCTSLMQFAHARTATRATSGQKVSMMLITMRFFTLSGETYAAPGRVEYLPTSMMSTPAAAEVFA
jgi:hypothetical protein